MKPNRILRKLFPKSIETPNWWSQGTEKYIFIDESRSLPYILVRKTRALWFIVMKIDFYVFSQILNAAIL